MKKAVITITLLGLLLASLIRVPILVKTNRRELNRYHYDQIIG